MISSTTRLSEAADSTFSYIRLFAQIDTHDIKAITSTMQKVAEEKDVERLIEIFRRLFTSTLPPEELIHFCDQFILSNVETEDAERVYFSALSHDQLEVFSYLDRHERFKELSSSTRIKAQHWAATHGDAKTLEQLIFTHGVESENLTRLIEGLSILSKKPEDFRHLLLRSNELLESVTTQCFHHALFSETSESLSVLIDLRPDLIETPQQREDLLRTAISVGSMKSIRELLVQHHFEISPEATENIDLQSRHEEQHEEIAEYLLLAKHSSAINRLQQTHDIPEEIMNAVRNAPLSGTLLAVLETHTHETLDKTALLAILCPEERVLSSCRRL